MATDKTTTKAICWRADLPGKRLQGEIVYGPTDGAEVDLFGHFLEKIDDKSFEERFTLHGQTFSAKLFTLFNSVVSGGQFHFPGGGSCKIKSWFGVVGGHYLSPDDVKFKSVEVQITGLIDWTCTTGIKFEAIETPRSLNLSYQIPAVIELGRFGCFSLRLQISSNAQPNYHAFEIKENCTLVIEADELQPYLAFEEYILKFEHFLCLAIQRPVCLLEAIGHIDKPKDTIRDIPIFEDFLILRKINLPDWSRDTLNPHDLFFNLYDLQPSPAEIFGKFVERESKLRASFDLYFSTIYKDNWLPRVEFLTLAQSLEAYHRATMPGKYISDDLYNEGLRKKLWDSVPIPPEIDADFRASLKNKLNYLHEFSLKKRLRELAKAHADILADLIGSANDFSDAISVLRNKLTHPLESCDEEEKDYRKMIRLSEMMALLLEVCFLSEIGFTREIVKAIIFNRSKRAVRIQRGWV